MRDPAPNIQPPTFATDWHCHLLPAVDDGPARIDESVEMAAALQKAGVKKVYCTPHLISGSFEADNKTVKRATAELQAQLNNNHVDLELLPGREYYLDEFLPRYLADPMPLGNTNFILIEIANHMPPEFVKEAFYLIKRRGYVPMIAHPERCRLFDPPEKKTKHWLGELLFRERPNSDYALLRAQSPARSTVRTGAPNSEHEGALLSYLRDLGCAFQANLGSFSARYRAHVQKTARWFQDEGFYTHSGTDLHSWSDAQALPQFIASYARAHG